MIRNDLRALLLERETERRMAATQERLFTLVENLQSQLEPEMQGWMASGTTDRDVPVIDIFTLIRRSREIYYREPHGRVVIRNLVKFIIGAGTVIDFHESDEEANSAIVTWWEKVKTANRWALRQREFVTRAFRDGNALIRRIDTQDSPFKLRFIDPEQLSASAAHPYGIETDPDDGETVLRYWIMSKQGGEPEPIPADEVEHLKIDVDMNVRLGRPITESVLNYLGKYGKWLDARMTLNIVRASVALVQEIKGSPNDLSRLRQAQQAQRQTAKETDKSKMLRSGTIIRGTPGVEYKMLSPNLDARDAAEDGATLLRGVAAGAGFPDVFVTSNYANSNFASTVVSQNQGIREFEDWSVTIGEHIGAVVRWALRDGLNKGEIPAEVTDAQTGKNRPLNLDFDVNFPPLIRRDLAQENTAYQIMQEHGALSLHTWMLKMGFNPDQEKRLIEEEEDMPTPPPTRNGKRAPKRVEDRNPRQQVHL